MFLSCSSSTGSNSSLNTSLPSPGAWPYSASDNSFTNVHSTSGMRRTCLSPLGQPCPIRLPLPKERGVYLLRNTVRAADQLGQRRWSTPLVLVISSGDLQLHRGGWNTYTLGTKAEVTQLQGAGCWEGNTSTSLLTSQPRTSRAMGRTS